MKIITANKQAWKLTSYSPFLFFKNKFQTVEQKDKKGGGDSPGETLEWVVSEENRSD